MRWQFASQMGPFGGSHSSPGSDVPLPQRICTQLTVMSAETLVLSTSSATQVAVMVKKPSAGHICSTEKLPSGSSVTDMPFTSMWSRPAGWMLGSSVSRSLGSSTSVKLPPV